jgi:hypothetical protein
VLGWWTPSEALFHPDVLAAYFPWFSALAPSLQAGFWEECLFRAVPIAGAALIGERIGQRRLMICLAFVVQAIVFGAGHAPYPTQPSYARAVELIVPSIMFGLVYLYFGLLPGIILHFTFDTVWFALPLFVSTAPGIWFDKTMVVVLALVPVWIVLAARARAGRWLELPPTLRNAAWSPPPEPIELPAIADDRPADVPVATRRALPALGLIALLVWALVTPFHTDVPGTTIDRRVAADAGQRAVNEAGAQLPPAYQPRPTVADGRDNSHRFVFDTAGRDVYMQLLGSYLSPPAWFVRFASFEGDVAERAEEWNVRLDGSGSIGGIRHTLPEDRAAPTVTDQQARDLAYAFIAQRYGLTRDKVREITVKPSRLKARTDWEVTVAELDAHGLTQGELRTAVSIAGDRVSGSRRFVYVPEEWERQHRNEATVALVMSIVGGLALVALLVGEAVVAIVSWSRRSFAVRLFLGFLLLQMVMRAVNSINQWPVLSSQFSTAQPYKLQRMILMVGLAVGVTVPSALLALIIGAAPMGVRRSHMSAGQMAMLGGSVGAIAAAMLALGTRLGNAGAPAWPMVAGADTYVPLVAAAVSLLSSYLLSTIGVLVIVMAADQVTHGWKRWRVPVAMLIFLIGVSIGALGASGGPLTWAAAGVATAILILGAYVAVLRYEPALLPLITAMLSLATAARAVAFRSFPGAAAGSVIGAMVVLTVAWWWSRSLAYGSGVTTGD